MTSSDHPTVHVIEFSPSMTDLLQQKAPHLTIKRIPCKNIWRGPDLAELGDPEEIEVLVTIGISFTKISEDGVRFPNLKWVHSVSAGVEGIVKYIKTLETAPHFVVTRSSISSDCVSEYAIGQIIAHRRSFYIYHDQQKSSIWNREPNSETPGRPLALCNYSVVLLGVGVIGRRVAAMCNALGMTVYGVTRTPVQKGDGSPDVHFYSTTEDLPSTLSEADYIVNMLPSTQQTKGILDNDTLRACRHKKPVFINVGRGDVINEDSIIKALRSDWISGAVLDVFPVEPLPPDSLLWREPGVTVTPHVAMNMGEDTQQKGVQSFLDNYQRFVNKQDLMNVVDFERGY